MSTKHLTVGSVDPPRVDGLLRIYSMKFCPYAQRALLVLKAKQLPHDVVNINLTRKPEWYSKVHPQGKVPALIDGSNVVVESIDISDYLDKKYPKNPLYPADPEAEKKDKEVIKSLVGAIESAFLKCIFTNEIKSPEDWTKLFQAPLQDLENELASRGTKFFGGDRPGMVDLMLWPWEERSECMDLKLGSKLKLNFPLLSQWKKSMGQHPVCQELHISGERFWKFATHKIAGTEPSYEEI